MSTKSPNADKRTDDSTESERPFSLIDESTIRRLEDEPAETDGPTCRFAAVAQSLETTRAPNTHFEIPVTVVAYVDESGEYAIEREYAGHRPDWSQIPRTVPVTADAPVRPIPSRHSARYAPVLATYERVLED